MQFTFLGTSAGVPSRTRNVTGLALSVGGGRDWYLIDCGEGTQHQLLRTRYTLHRLRAIFITHVHGDHTYGLPGLLASAALSGRAEPLCIVGPKPVKTFLDAVFAATDMRLPFHVDFQATENANFDWCDEMVQVSTVALSHRVPCHAFVFTERKIEKKLQTDKLRGEGIEAGPAWGALQRGNDVQLSSGRMLRSGDYTLTPRSPRRAVVAGDNDMPEILEQACRNAHLLIHEATYTQEVSDRVGPAPQHSSAMQVARFAQSVNLPNLILTHFSPRYQPVSGQAPSMDEIADEARRFYHGNLHLARDFAEFLLDRELNLVSL